MNPFRFYFLLSLLLFFLLVLPCCQLNDLEKNLSPDNSDFLSKVTYLITQEERKAYLELSDSDRAIFEEDFWQRHDPRPDTEENELKIEYFKRMGEANRLFMGEGKQGWLTDRGRIFILFGRPTDKDVRPSGADAFGQASEIWYYGTFPVVFVDSTRSGTYRLITLNLAHLNDLSLAFQSTQRTYQRTPAEKHLDFTLEIGKLDVYENRLEGVILIEVPYTRLWLNARGTMQETILEVSLELRDQGERRVWESRRDFEIELGKKELAKKKGDKFRIEIFFIVEEGLEALHKGKNKVYVTLRNKTGGELVQKAREFSLQQNGHARRLKV